MSGGNDDDDDDRREYLCRCVNPGDGSLRDGEPFRVEDRERDEARRDCVDRGKQQVLQACIILLL